MRREHLELTASGVGWVETDGEPEKPTVHIDATATEAANLLADRLTDADESVLAAADMDIAVRLLEHPEDEETTGVVSVTDRLTGEFILELNENADDVLSFITAARKYGEQSDADGRYAVHITADGETLAEFEKTTFLVYNEDGDLLRRHSLIPSGVEL
jgi:hypothetical protein